MDWTCVGSHLFFFSVLSPLFKMARLWLARATIASLFFLERENTSVDAFLLR